MGGAAMGDTEDFEEQGGWDRRRSALRTTDVRPLDEARAG
ncbi:hypothetical protein D187_005715 [Cystobacter fuscus DSM 2262]|uniref:Uncharacterized protein n=1 Tax=Cystobacter fuscus (strain ATCC 25194 / DSM 2262 / NBRC 100088 / M29) TaxID=1242864 RepID=S9QPR7_CYSF2|nr:hypothetical protein D187_005715 [Cystobacter fuscus DSM 2262]